MSAPASTTSQAILTPVASSTRWTVAEISGPVPSPGINVTLWVVMDLSLEGKKVRLF
jgi:hypothetical protein